MNKVALFFITYGLLISILFTALLFTVNAEGQYLDPFEPRPVAQFPAGQEFECKTHWINDLNILRQWQQEFTYWNGEYNLCALTLNLGENYWPANPTLEQYPVDAAIIEKELAEGKYKDFISACNAHIRAAHLTEGQFANETYQAHLNTCHCRNTLGVTTCTSEFIRTHPYRYVQQHQH